MEEKKNGNTNNKCVFVIIAACVTILYFAITTVRNIRYLVPNLTLLSILIPVLLSIAVILFMKKGMKAGGLVSALAYVAYEAYFALKGYSTYTNIVIGRSGRYARFDIDEFLHWVPIVPLLLALLLLFAVLASHVKRNETRKNGNEAREYGAAASVEPCYCELYKHILLLFFTCGIWMYIWIYRITGYLNCVENEEYRDPTKKLLLCMFIPFYQIYWTYKSAQRVDKLAEQRGTSSDISTLCLILAIFFNIVPPIIIQENVNTIITHKPAAVQPVSSGNADLDMLEKIAMLHEQGILTDEEFQKKKADILAKI